MNDWPQITVLCGGASAESAVSLVSGKCVADALRGTHDVVLRVLPDNTLPLDLNPTETVVFPAMHGDFGEDGALQALLQERGFAFAGSGSESSALCMHKSRTKARVADCGFALAQEIIFPHDQPPCADEAVARLGDCPVLKPADKGSSVGLTMPDSSAALRQALQTLPPGLWMLEQHLTGREMTIGLLDGEALGIVEIFPQGGVYDYARKYTGGTTRYEYPARLDASLSRSIQDAAETAFRLCDCRDFARVDFILCGGVAYFLEINTIPGLTPTSLLPKSASSMGMDFNQLARRMIEPAFARMAGVTIP